MNSNPSIGPGSSNPVTITSAVAASESASVASAGHCGDEAVMPEELLVHRAVLGGLHDQHDGSLASTRRRHMSRLDRKYFCEWARAGVMG